MIAGRYTLDREIGRGGMGAVWSGTDLTLGRTVAIKRIGVAPGGGATDVDRAEREARLAARLNHPHVVAVFDLVDEDDAQWMVMEYVEGTNLSEIVRASGPLPPDQIAPILAQVADALAAAHGAGIVHRDVKPSNILVAPDGNVKLTDFGIARTEADAALTQTGLVTGSPAYLAPEVASGRVATEASDVWSLGATLCHALTGKPPYDVGDNVMGALYRIVNEEPPRPDNAGWLAPVLAASMVRDPAQRGTAAQLKDLLQAGPPATAPPTEPVKRVEAAVGPAVPTRTVLAAGPAESHTQVLPPAAPFVPAETSRPRRRTPWTAVAVVAVLAVVAIAFLIGLTSDDPEDPGDQAAGQDETPSASADGTGPATASKADMEAFIDDYLTLVTKDPEAAFELLTPDYQDASEGIEGYRGFWDTVSNTKLLSVDANPKTMTVDYRYRYNVRGDGPRTEDVSLRLVRTDDGGYLIAGTA